MPKHGELKREFREAGCRKVREGGRHEEWFSPITEQTFRMSRHDKEECKKGTEMQLRKLAGVPKRR